MKELGETRSDLFPVEPLLKFTHGATHASKMPRNILATSNPLKSFAAAEHATVIPCQGGSASLTQRGHRGCPTQHIKLAHTQGAMGSRTSAHAFNGWNTSCGEVLSAPHDAADMITSSTYLRKVYHRREPRVLRPDEMGLLYDSENGCVA